MQGNTCWCECQQGFTDSDCGMIAGQAGSPGSQGRDPDDPCECPILNTNIQVDMHVRYS